MQTKKLQRTLTKMYKILEFNKQVVFLAGRAQIEGKKYREHTNSKREKKTTLYLIQWTSERNWNCENWAEFAVELYFRVVTFCTKQKECGICWQWTKTLWICMHYWIVCQSMEMRKKLYNGKWVLRKQLLLTFLFWVFIRVLWTSRR